MALSDLINLFKFWSTSHDTFKDILVCNMNTRNTILNTLSKTAWDTFSAFNVQIRFWLLDSFKAYIPKYYSRQNPFIPAYAEKVAEEVLLYVFNTALPASL